MSGQAVNISQLKHVIASGGDPIVKRVQQLEDDMKFVKNLIQTNNDTLMAIMDAIKAEQSK